MSLMHPTITFKWFERDQGNKNILLQLNKEGFSFYQKMMTQSAKVVENYIS